MKMFYVNLISYREALIVYEYRMPWKRHWNIEYRVTGMKNDH